MPVPILSVLLLIQMVDPSKNDYFPTSWFVGCVASWDQRLRRCCERHNDLYGKSGNREINHRASAFTVPIDGTMTVTGTVTVTPDHDTTRKRFMII